MGGSPTAQAARLERAVSLLRGTSELTRSRSLAICAVWMRRAIAILALVLAVASPASAQGLDTVYTVSEWAVLTGHAMDLASTQRCLGAGRCTELNPLLARYESPVTFTAAKFGLAAAQLWATRRMKRTHPKIATVANFAIAAGFTALAIRNTRIGGQ